MAITPQIQSALQGFNEIILGGIPFLLKQNETAFLSFMCSVAAIDALADKLDRQIIRYKDRRRAHPHDALKHRSPSD